MSRFETVIAARYGRVIDVVDAHGRTISVRRIRLSEHVRVAEIADREADRVALLCAAAVTSIEGHGRIDTFEPGAGEHRLWHLVSRLGEAGLAAVTYAIWQHAAANDHDGPAAPLQGVFHPFGTGAELPAMPLPRLPDIPSIRRPAVPASFRVADVVPSFLKPKV